MASYQDFQRNFTKNLERAIRRTFGRNYFNNLGELILETILRRTRAGYGVSESGGSQSRLLPLSRDYVEHRRMFSGLSSYTSPKRSNLTYTGRMLNDLGFRPQGETRNQLGGLMFSFRTTESTEKAEMVSGRRPFLNLTAGDIRKITREARAALAKNLARISIRS